MSKKNVYVVRNGQNWATKNEGSTRVGKLFTTQKEAIEAGKAQAKRQASELIIQDRQGKFREKNSYGNDPKNIKG